MRCPTHKVGCKDGELLLQVQARRCPDFQMVHLEHPLAFLNAGFDGLITNDKFCFVRTAHLQLNWWRRPLRLRQAQSPVDATFWEKGNLPGGTDETGVADSATDGGASGWTTAMGSGISVPAAMGPNHITGGAECE